MTGLRARIGRFAVRHRLMVDIAERVTWTFAQAGAGALVDAVTSGALNPIRVAIYAGLLAVAKGLGASKIGDSDSAAALPVIEDDDLAPEPEPEEPPER